MHALPIFLSSPTRHNPVALPITQQPISSPFTAHFSYLALLIYIPVIMLRQLLLLSAVFYQGSNALQLHVKAGPDGKTVGDCPFAHAIQICCAVKKLNVEVIPHSPSEKPAWLIEEHGGKMPCLVADPIIDGEVREVVTESRAIAQWLEAKYPEPPMDSLPGTAAAEEVVAPVFGAFA